MTDDWPHRIRNSDALLRVAQDPREGPPMSEPRTGIQIPRGISAGMLRRALADVPSTAVVARIGVTVNPERPGVFDDAIIQFEMPDSARALAEHDHLPEQP